MADVNFNSDAMWRKRMALQVANNLPQDADPHTQIKILRLAIQLVETFLIDERASLNVISTSRP
jgi:hypothetical protein